MSRGDSHRSGFALLEAIIAITILSLSGVLLVTTAAEAHRAVVSAAVADAELLAASRLLDAVSLWSRTELDQRLGERPQGEMRMEIIRLTGVTYQVRLRSADERLLLATVLYRSDARAR